MTTAVWPSTVPPPLADVKIEQSRVMTRVETDGGTGRQWQRAENPARRGTFEWLLDGGEWEQLLHWMEYDAGYGNNWFTAPWIDTLLGPTNYLGRFYGPPEISRRGLLFGVSLPVELQLSSLAVPPVASDWPLSSNPNAYNYDEHMMVFRWEANSEATGDGSMVSYMDSLESLGTYLARQDGNQRMGVDGGKRGLRLDGSQGFLRPSVVSRVGWNYALLDAYMRNFTYAVVLTPGSSTQGFVMDANPSQNTLEVRNASILLSTYGGVDQNVAYTLRASGRVCVILTMQVSGDAKVYADGNLLIDQASSSTMSNGNKFKMRNTQSTSPFYTPVHEIIIWHRAIDSAEAADVSAKLMTDWDV